MSLHIRTSRVHQKKATTKIAWSTASKQAMEQARKSCLYQSLLDLPNFFGSFHFRIEKSSWKTQAIIRSKGFQKSCLTQRIQEEAATVASPLKSKKAPSSKKHQMTTLTSNAMTLSMKKKSLEDQVEQFDTVFEL